MDEKFISIAIDGPASAGKSTIAKKVAMNLEYLYIDTGAMFRAITYKLYKNNIDINEPDSVHLLLENTELQLKGNSVLLDNVDVSNEIRTNKVSKLVSKVSENKLVRDKMLKLQREMAHKNSVVMDGRDIGTVVLPDADLKIFLTASVDVRAKRRYKELKANGEKDISLKQIKDEITERDRIDMNRDIAPLKVSKDAYKIDNSNLTIDESVNKIIDLLKAELDVI